MELTTSSVLPNYLQKSLLLGVLVALALVIAGRLLVPTTSLVSTIAASAILLAYGGMAAPSYTPHLRSFQPSARGV